MIRIGKEVNVFAVHSQRINKVMVSQHLEINATFEDINLFKKVLAHEYMHMILNKVIDNSCNVSLMFDNIDGFVNDYEVSI